MTPSPIRVAWFRHELCALLATLAHAAQRGAPDELWLSGYAAALADIAGALALDVEALQVAREHRARMGA